jgi:tRNA(Arg) A34 adenosine deaminase TadA
VGEKVETHIQFSLPQWLIDYQHQYRPSRLPQQQLAFVIEASRLNCQHQTGGPFAAGVFTMETGQLVSLGVNLVTQEQLSILHAEIVAISLAQRALGQFDLSAAHEPLSLVTSTEPCAMCFGAIPWSGVRQVVCAAADADARAIGFDEGPKPVDWELALQQRHISVQSGLLREEAVAVLQSYVQQGGLIYNPSDREAL